MRRKAIARPSRVRFLAAAALSTVCVGALLVLAPSASAGGAARVTQDVRVIEQNIDFGLNPGTLPNLETQLRDENPDVVMVIEICRAEVQQFQSAFPSWHTHYTPMRTYQDGCAEASGGVTDPYSKGEMLASPHSITSVTRYDLADSPNDTTRSFHMTCGNVLLGSAGTAVLRACATHLRNGRDEPWKLAERRQQTGQIKSILAPQIAAGRAVVLSGDFNTRPEEDPLDAIYGLNTSGQYTSSGGQFDESQQARRQLLAQLTGLHEQLPLPVRSGHRARAGPTGGSERALRLHLLLPRLRHEPARIPAAVQRLGPLPDHLDGAAQPRHLVTGGARRRTLGCRYERRPVTDRPAAAGAAAARPA